MTTGRLAPAAIVFVLVGLSGRAQIPAGQRVGLTVYLKASYGGLKSNLLAAAEEMPGADYTFKPSATSEMRTYGQLFVHVAAGQFGACATLKGMPDPVQDRKLEQELRSKTEIVRLLSDSFAFCDDAVASLTDQNATELVRLAREKSRSAGLGQVEPLSRSRSKRLVS